MVLYGLVVVFLLVFVPECCLTCVMCGLWCDVVCVCCCAAVLCLVVFVCARVCACSNVIVWSFVIYRVML